MRLAYYMPFKSPDAPNPSGDQVIGREILSFLRDSGQEVEVASRLRCRWFYWKPSAWLRLLLEYRRVVRRYRHNPPDIWCTYHSYYKAPDLLGMSCARRLGIAYVVFQGIYSTKRRRSLKTLPGFLINRKVLQAASLVLTNKLVDEKNLLRLLPREKVVYIAPGLYPEEFSFDPQARKSLCSRLQLQSPVILTAAMFRPGVKTRGILQVIEACALLREQGQRFHLLIVGDGQERQMLERAARDQLGKEYCFVGKVERATLYQYYSAADLFVFPGIEESLGMVYLEAQACGLPVVACGDWGAATVVRHGVTGLLSAAREPQRFRAHIQTLLDDRERRRTMGRAAREHVKVRHDLRKNYQLMLRRLEQLCRPD
ncbi:glycosyl transferase [Desulfolithobacter dissulfuricans]|uniref:Glycosyl transferase n=1 Tax=Desulfolithobacter dissulfuricans TaxID=2795293 RepID=A0A915U271_9BACT|nr:glycosyltransferase family 4 protein [Desulfolithobacter dissulfuricans]BCO09465.1 glycosyl transferase [Desulfolithobacter dissulfuricans]